MIASLLANIGIILLNMYVLWKLSTDNYISKMSKSTQFLILLAIETFVGYLLLNYSIVILDVHLDLRPVLFAISMKYLGGKLTLPLIFLVGVLRFFHGGEFHSFLNSLIVLVVLFTYTQVYEWSKKYFSDVIQMVILSGYYILVAVPSAFMLLNDIRLVLYLYSTLFLISTIVIFVLQKVLIDVEHLSDRAVIDNLTKLYNSQKFREDLERLSFSENQYALLVIDIDDFKRYNDQYGHLVGDLVISEIANVLSSMPQDDHLFYRYGGEEFVTLIEDCSGDKATNLASDIHRRIKDLRIALEDGEILEVTVSIGVAYRVSKEELMATFQRADDALYVAKANGKDQISIH